MQKTKTEEMHRLSAIDYRTAPKVPLIVVLDNVRSQHNIGAVFRTADAFRIEGVWLCGICCCPPNPEIHKTALGAELTVAWQYRTDTTEAIRELQTTGYTVYAVEQAHGAAMLQDIHLPQGQKTAVVFGHEVFGVKQEAVDRADGCIEIPQYGTKHSLNVSVTAGIVMYELACQLRA